MADNDFRLIVKAEELAEHSFRLTINSDRYPKKFRHSLCDRIQLKSLDIYDTLLEANTISNVTNKNERCEMITKAITYCTQLLFYIKLSMRLGLLKGGSAEYWSKLATDVKHMAIAWRSKEKE